MIPDEIGRVEQGRAVGHDPWMVAVVRMMELGGVNPASQPIHIEGEAALPLASVLLLRGILVLLRAHQPLLYEQSSHRLRLRHHPRLDFLPRSHSRSPPHHSPHHHHLQHSFHPPRYCHN